MRASIPGAMRIGLAVLLAATGADARPPRRSTARPAAQQVPHPADRALAVPAFTAPEELSIFGPEVGHAVGEALARAGFEVASTGLRVDGRIEALDAERVRLGATVGGRAAQVEGRLEEIDALAGDLSGRIVLLVPASMRRAMPHAGTGRRPAGKAPGTPLALGDHPAGAAADPITDSVGIQLPRLTPAIDPTPPLDEKPAAKPEPPKESTPPASPAPDPAPHPAEIKKPDPPPVAPPPSPPPPSPPVPARVDPAHTDEKSPYDPLPPPPRRTPIAPIAPPAPPPMRVVLHAVRTPTGCNPDDAAIAMARQVLTRNGLSDVVVAGCGVAPPEVVAAEARRAGAAGVVMSDVVWMRMEGTVFGYHAVGEVRVIAVRDGRVVVSQSFGLTSRILPSPDPQRGAVELAQLAFQRLGRTIGLAYLR